MSYNKLLLFLFVIIPMRLFAQNDTIQAARQLREVIVSGKYIQQEADHYNCIPTSKQRRHSHSGFELVRNMMIAGVDVNTEGGSVTTPAGAAALYINGRGASFREIQSLRPKDVVRIEYYDMPTGKYAKDKAAMNFIVRTYNYGGYAQVDGLQGLDYKKGDYNTTSRYSFGKYNMNVWAGYNISNPKVDVYSIERYQLPEEVTKTSVSCNNDKEKIGRYFTASLSRMSQKTTWMLRASIENNRDWDNTQNGSTLYSGMGLNDGYNVNSYLRNSTVKPTFYAYYNRTLDRDRSLDAVFDSYYARNKYKRDMQEYDRYISDVDEDYFYSKFNANYNISLPKQNFLTFSLHEYLRVSQDDYKNLNNYGQHLRSSETIFFIDYSKRWKKMMVDINPGVSYLVYKIHGDEAVKHIAPRLQMSYSWMPDKIQRVRLFFSLGNTFPSLSYVNHVEQQIDRLMLRRGNPTMDNSTLLGPRLTYSVNYKSWSALLSSYYMYMSNAIVGTYSSEGGKVVNSFTSDSRNHQSVTSLSLTWKPTSDFNVKMDGSYSYFAVNRAVHERLGGWQMGIQANYYVGDFSFSASCSSESRILQSYQTHIRTPWQYGLSAEWSHENIAVILEAKNLFVQNNVIKNSLYSGAYDISERMRRESDNSFASLKFVCSLDYGKKVSHSPKYEVKDTGSTILR